MFNLLTLFLFPLLGSMNQANFPEVLSECEEKEYLEKWKNKDINARNVLIEHNLRLVAHIVKKFENTKVEKDDLLSIGTFGLIKAVDSYNFESNVRLATYASRCIENEILMHLRNIKKYKDTISLYTPIGEDKEGNEIKICDVIIDPSPSMTDELIKLEHYEKLRQALTELNPQELEIISRRFGLNNYQVETQRDIAKSMGISRSYVSRIEKRALTKLYLKLKD
ncbi:MAG: sigma-70 family RNA polymerase sigma factor [Erysipelotrichaceae bacterium]|nr:sigma-70 family RNA polymerase sigma factor [Erysipelotrichaceae bacterium]